MWEEDGGLCKEMCGELKKATTESVAGSVDTVDLLGKRMIRGETHKSHDLNDAAVKRQHKQSHQKAYEDEASATMANAVSDSKIFFCDHFVKHFSLKQSLLNHTSGCQSRLEFI